MACSRSRARDSSSAPSSGVSNIEVASRFEKSNQLYQQGASSSLLRGGNCALDCASENFENSKP